MIIENAKYAVDPQGVVSCIIADIDGENVFVPLEPENRHYAEIMAQVEAGTLTIQDAD